MSVRALASIGVEVRELERWAAFATEILGLAIEERAADGTLSLRMDDRSHRIAVHPGERDDLISLHWEVASAADLRAIVARLTAAGYAVDASETQAAAIDPNGVRNAFALDGPPLAATPFVSPRGLSGFVTGEGGVGHVVLAVDDAEATAAFYRDALGMRVSDYVAFERDGQPVTMTFLHCNARHHSLAFVRRPGAPRRLSHLMLEARSLDDVGLTYSLCERERVPIAMTLGRHTNDDMFSFYLVSPSGFNIEFGYGGKPVDDATWQIAHYDATSVWGHARQPEGIIR